MLRITLKSGRVDEFPSASLTKETVINRLEGDIWYLETDNYVEVYRTSEIAHVQISK